MRRRQLFAVAAALALAGCVATKVRPEPDVALDAHAFTPEGVKDRLARAATFEDVARIYGPCDRRSLSMTTLPGLHECVWDFKEQRPSFAVVKSERPYMRPTVRKSLHIWFDSRNRVAAHELTGESCVEVLRPPIPLVVMGVRPLTGAELAGTAIPAVAGESLAEVTAWNAGHAAHNAHQKKA